MKKNNCFSKFFIFVFFLVTIFSVQETKAQFCSVNAGVKDVICANERMFLRGGLTAGEPGQVTTWSQIAGPTVHIVDPNELTTEVIGFLPGMSYTFRISTICSDGTLTFQDVVKEVRTISPANVTSPNFSGCPESVGSLSGTPPAPGETGRWVIVGGNGAGVGIENYNSPNTTFTLHEGACGVSQVQWLIECIHDDRTCSNMSTPITIVNYGGTEPITADVAQMPNHCYSTTTSAQLIASNGGCGQGGQQGTWSVISGPNLPSFSNIHSNNAKVSGLIEGTYVLRWTVEGPCYNGFDDVVINVPHATADITQAVSTESEIKVCDPGVSAVFLEANEPGYLGETSRWTIVSQPPGANANIVNPTSSVTEVNNLTPEGTYEFRYFIEHLGNNCYSHSTVKVIFLPNPPTLDVEEGPIILPCGSSNARVVYDADGSGITQYRIISGPSSLITPSLPFSYPTSWMSIGNSPGTISGFTLQGDYLVELRRHTALGDYCSDVYDQVHVIASEIPVEANAGTKQVLACNAESTILAGNAPCSFDPETGNPMVQYLSTWTQVSGPETVDMGNPCVQNLAISNLSPGLYRFRYTISGGPACLSKSSETTVLVAPTIPEVQNAGDDQDVCLNTPIQLAATAPNSVLDEGTWSVYTNETPPVLVTTAVFSDIHDPNAIVDPLPQGSYIFRWTIENGCGIAHDDAIINVSNHPGPIAADAGDDECIPVPVGADTTATLNGNDPGAGMGMWRFISGPNTPNIVSVTHHNTEVTGLIEGDYVFEWEIMGDDACVPTKDRVMITVGQPPAFVPIPNVDLCGDREVVLVADDPNPYPGHWSQIAGPYVAINDPTNTQLELTNLIYHFDYVIRWTVSNGACVNHQDVVVTASPVNETVDAGPDFALCQQNSVQLAAVPQPGARWTFISGPNLPPISDMSDPNATLSGLIMGTYKLAWVNSSSARCEPKQDTITIVVVPQANAGSDRSYCEAIQTVSLQANPRCTGVWSYISGPSGAEVTVTPVTGNRAKAEGLSLVGDYTFRYTITATVEGISCDSYDEVVITIEEEPTVAAAGADQDLCNEITFQMNGNEPTSGTGRWSKLFGPAGGSFDDATSPNAVYNGAVPGLYVFEWRISNGDCSNADQVRIQNYAPPSIANAGADQELICATEITLAGNSPEIGVGMWSLVSKDDATAPEPTITTPMVYNSTVTGLGPKSDGSHATYKFEWKITNGPVCDPTRDSMVVTVYKLPLPAEAGPDQTFCNEFTHTLSANEVPADQTGTWSVVEKPADATDPVFVSGINAHNTVVNFDNTKHGTYKLKWTTRADYCESEDIVEIIIYDEPSTPSVASDSIDRCQFFNLTLEATVDPSPQVGTGIWTQTAGPTPTIIANPTALSTPVYGLTTDSYEFTYTITNGTCEPKSVVQAVNIYEDPPMAATGANVEECLLTSLPLNGFTYPSSYTGPYPPTNYMVGEWTIEGTYEGTPTFTPNANAYNATVSGLVPGSPNEYRLRWTVANGICQSYDEKIIKTWSKPSDPVVRVPIDTCFTDRFTIYATEPAIVTGVWTQKSGPSGATIATPNNTSTLVNITQAGNYVFTWTVSHGVCAPKSQDLSVDVDPPITVPAPTSNYTNVCVGAQPTLTANPTGGTGTGTYTYQWQQSSGNCNGPWSDITGATSKTYQTPVLDIAGNYYYRVLVKDAKECVTAESGCTTIRVYADPTVSQTVTPADVCKGGDSYFDGYVSGGVSSTYTYRWQYNSGDSNNPIWNDITYGVPTGISYSTSSDSTYSRLYISTTTTPLDTHFYRLYITSSALGCDPATSNSRALVVWDDPIINTQPVGADLCAGETHTLSVDAVGDLNVALSYQWQRSSDGSSWYPISGATNTSYTTPVYTPTGSTITTQYYRVIITQPNSGCSTHPLAQKLPGVQILLSPVVPALPSVIKPV